MRRSRALRGVALCLAGVLSFAIVAAQAQEERREAIALKSGEKADLGELYLVVNCKSLLTGPISAEVMDGPPGVTVSVKQQDVLPHKAKCWNKVPGGRLIVSAPQEIKEKTSGTLVVRTKYPIADGERQVARVLDVHLFP